MKKVIIAITAFLYIFVSSGIAMDIHYCMGKKTAVELYGSADDKCSKCGMKAKKGCCSEEYKFYKINDSHKSVSNDVSFENTFVTILTSYPVYNCQALTIAACKTIQNNSPPDYTKPSACILNCVFRL